MKNSIFLILACLTLSACNYYQELTQVEPVKRKATQPPLTDAAYLRKLSFHLKGENPAGDEYAALKVAEESGSSEAFLEKKITEYLKSPQFASKMRIRIDELMRVRSPSTFSHWPMAPEEKLDRSAYAQIIKEVVSENKPWDDLLLSKKFRVYRQKASAESSFGRIDDSGFFRQAYSGALPRSTVYSPGKYPTDETNDFVDILFPPDFAQAAGIVTTARFYDRFSNTTINKNRRRAAAIYRIFLCDDMVPVAAAGGTGDTSEILKLVYPTKNKTAILKTSDVHGSDPACMKCHSKLDPVGAAFTTSPFILSSRPNLGTLNTEKLDGSQTSTPYRGFEGLARALVAEEKYSACQVQHFWTWFIGNDRSLAGIRQRELMAAFDNVDRRTGDFVAHLVQLPEFREAPVADREETVEELHTLVKPLLKRCDSCHSSHPEEGLPMFGDDLIGGTAQTHVRYVARIAKALDLANGGIGAKMPPPEARWLLTSDEKSMLYRWSGKVLEGVKP